MKTDLLSSDFDVKHCSLSIAASAVLNMYPVTEASFSSLPVIPTVKGCGQSHVSSTAENCTINPLHLCLTVNSKWVLESGALRMAETATDFD